MRYNSIGAAASPSLTLPRELSLYALIYTDTPVAFFYANKFGSFYSQRIRKYIQVRTAG
jgi:hypothetical protein